MRTVALSSMLLAAWVLAGCERPAEVAATPMVTEVRTNSWADENFSGRELVSQHYRIYTTSTSPSVLGYLPGFMEAAHANYLGITGLPDRPDRQRLPIYMMATRAEWVALTRSVVGPQANLYNKIEAGGYCYKGVCVFWDMGGVAAMSVASHEGMHQFLSRRLKDRLPMWLEEGLAVLSEGYQVHGQSVRFTPERNASRFTALRRSLVNDWWIPLERLLPMDGGDAVQLGHTARAVGYYGQLWAMGQFLRSDPAFAAGRARMLADAEAGRFHQALNLSKQDFLRRFRRGRAYNRRVSLPLFRRYVSEDLEAFDRRYRAFARKIVRLE